MDPSSQAAPVVLLTLADPPRATELSVALNAAGELSTGAGPLIVFPALSVPSSGGLSSTARQALCFLTLHDVCGSSGAAEVFVAQGAPENSPHELEGLLLLHRPCAVLVSLADLEWVASTAPEHRDAVCNLIGALVERGAPVVDISPPVDSAGLTAYSVWPPSAPPATTLHGLLDRLHDSRVESRHVMRVYASDTAESCAERIAAAGSSGLGPGDAGLPLLLGRTALQCIERYGMYGLGGADGGAAAAAAAAPSVVASVRSRYCWWRDPPASDPSLARLPHAPFEAGLAPGGAAVSAPATSQQLAAPECDQAGALRSGDAQAYRIAVLGGSFNPVTLAHTQVVAEVLAAGAADEVWLVPCGRRADKPTLDTPGAHRTAMTALAIEAAFPASTPAFVVPLERWEDAAIPSYLLMARLASLAGNAGGAVVAAPPACDGATASFSLIIGADLLPTLASWRFAPRLLAEVAFLCVPRPGYAPPPAPESGGAASTRPRRIATVERTDGAPLATMQLSSTAVRRVLATAPSLAAAGRRAAGLVAPQVLAYALASGCYGPMSGPPPPPEHPLMAKSLSELYTAPLLASPTRRARTASGLSTADAAAATSDLALDAWVPVAQDAAGGHETAELGREVGGAS